MNAVSAFCESDFVTCAPVANMPGGLSHVELGVSPGSFSGQISNDDYHACADYLSTSMIKPLLRSPAHLAAYRDNADRDGSPNLGSAVHAGVLEPARFAKDFCLYAGTRRGKAWEAFQAQHPGRTILSEVEMATVGGVRRAIENFGDYPLAKAIEVGEVEKSIFWVDALTGVKCRMRADLWTGPVNFDLKTIDDARPESVIRQVMRMDYDLQAAVYTEGSHAYCGQHKPFIFIFVELKPPYGIWLYPAGASILESGRRKFREGLEAYRRLQETNDWHCYRNAITTLELPRWAQPRPAAGTEVASRDCF